MPSNHLTLVVPFSSCLQSFPASGSFHAYGIIWFFFVAICMYVPYLLYPFIQQWKFRCFSCPGVNSAKLTLWCMYFFFQIMFFSVYIPWSKFTALYGSSIFCLLKNLFSVLHNNCTNLHSHQQWRKAPVSPPSSLFMVCRFFDDGHSDWCEVIHHCNFYFHFS